MVKEVVIRPTIMYCEGLISLGAALKGIFIGILSIEQTVMLASDPQSVVPNPHDTRLLRVSFDRRV